MRRVSRFFAISLLTFASLTACGPKDDPITNNTTPNNNGQEPETPVSTKPSKQIQQADQFAIDALATYYLWTKEIYNDLEKLNPNTCTDPITVVHDIRYHTNKKEVDLWTQLTDDLKSTPQQFVEDKEAADILLRAMGKLPYKWRKIVEMREWEQMSFAEIADVLGTTESSCRGMMSKARKRLLQLINTMT